MIRFTLLSIVIFIGCNDTSNIKVSPSRDAYVATKDPFGEVVSNVTFLDQNWSAAESIRFYFTPQGSQLIPYDWFLALEQPDSQKLFRDDQHILKYRYLPQRPGELNPDGLPIGFVANDGVARRWLGLTCAACHTNEIHYQGVGYRIDGAPAQGDIQGFLTALIIAMRQTQADDQKFDRFAKRVLKSPDDASRSLLREQLHTVIVMRTAYNQRNFPQYQIEQDEVPSPEHYGRLDAIGAIVNEVYFLAAKNRDPQNPARDAKPADAPVSYPCLWDTPHHDFVEWIGIAQSGGAFDINSLSRNVGEVIGVFGDVSIPEHPNAISLGYPSSVKIKSLRELEELLKTLWSPEWPASFPKIDETLVASGKVHYEKHCLSCHERIDRDDPRRKVVALMEDTGTDRRASDNFFKRSGPSGKLEGMNVNFLPLSPTISDQSDAKTMLSHVVIGTILGAHKDAPADELNKIHFSGKIPRALVDEVKYKARPLNGIWATAPYLHNGSVPSLADLLEPSRNRPEQFSMGARGFDPVKVGFVQDLPGLPKFQVRDHEGNTIPGNSNGGHEYGTSLNATERLELIEYLKTL